MRNRFTYTESADNGHSLRLTAAVIGAVLFFGIMSALFILLGNDFDIKKVLGTRTEEAVSEETESIDKLPAAVVTADRDEYNYLLLCADEENGLQFIAEITARISANKISALVLSENCIMDAEGTAMTLSAAYEANPYGFLQMYLSARGDDIYRYLVITPTQFRRLMTELGAVDMEIKKDTTCETEDGQYTFRAGTQSLTSDLLLRFMTKSGTGTDLLENRAYALERILQTHFTAEKLAADENYFSRVITYFTTNISIYDYTKAADIVYAFALARPEIIGSYTLTFPG